MAIAPVGTPHSEPPPISASIAVSRIVGRIVANGPVTPIVVNRSVGPIVAPSVINTRPSVLIPAEMPAVVMPASMAALSAVRRYGQTKTENGDAQRHGNSAKNFHKPSLK